MSGTPHTFAERHAMLESALLAMRDPQERLAWVVERARARPGFPPECRVDSHRVPGCAARLWLLATTENGRCRFACDSDSAMLKAMAGLLTDLYDGLPREEVVTCEPAFLGRTGLLGQLTENRRRTVLRVREAMRDHAGARPG